MHDSDDEENIRLYSDLLSQHGPGPRALDWASSESQNLRFRVLSEIGDLRGTHILDVGCGIGDLYLWLCKQGISVSYTGIDITPGMIEVARERVPDCDFRESNLSTFAAASDAKFDFVFASGIFCKRKHNPSAFLKETVQTMFSLCTKGAAFNSLSTWTNERSAGEYHADPLDTLLFCRGITPWVCVRHDYHARDFTIYMHRARTQ